MSEKMAGVMGCGAAILVFGFGLLQLAAGWAGIEHQFGWGWGLAAIAAALLFRFTIPMVVGGFLCAKDIWGWHWGLALLFAAPGLLFMVPAFFGAMVDMFKRR